MNQTYHIFGLKIRSSLPLPAQIIADFSADDRPDVIIEYGNTPKKLFNPRDERACYQATPGEFLLRIDSVASYYVRDGNKITITPNPEAGEEQIRIFLMGSAIGALLHQRNILVLHAGAIAVNGRGVLFSGHSGTGKSTLAAAFHKRGYPFLADDVCAVIMTGGQPEVIPGFSRLKLWGDVLKKLDQDKDQLESVRWTETMDKYFLPVETVDEKPLSLESVFILSKNCADKIDITELNGHEKIYPIINNTYRLGFLNGLGGKNHHFRQCAAVAARTRVHSVTRPDKGFRLNELMDLLEANF